MSPQSGEAYDRLVDGVWREALPSEVEVRCARRRLHRKALTIATLVVVSYTGLVVADLAAILRVGAGAVLLVALVALATCVMHDANHGAFSQRRWVNRSLSYTSDALGSSSWLWRIQHNGLHHGSTNVVGFDADIELAPLARFAPTQPWRPHYRFQHIYIWPLYGFMALTNLLYSDVRALVRRRIGDQPLNREVTGGVVAQIAAGKLAHLGLAVGVPLLFNPWQWVLAVYVACSWLLGFVLAVIFQLAHCVEATDATDLDVPRRGRHRVAHQLRTTADIASPAPVVGHLFRWIAGGLDHQVEHHLAPGLPHTVYPDVAERFRTACVTRGIDHHRHAGIGLALRSHARWLRRMGEADPVAVCAGTLSPALPLQVEGSVATVDCSAA